MNDVKIGHEYVGEVKDVFIEDEDGYPYWVGRQHVYDADGCGYAVLELSSTDVRRLLMEMEEQQE